MATSGTTDDRLGTGRPAGRLLGHRLLIGISAIVLVVVAGVLLVQAGRSIAGNNGLQTEARPIPASTSVQPRTETHQPSDPSDSPTAAGPRGEAERTTEQNRGPAADPTAEGRSSAAAAPARIKIPSLGVDTSVMNLGLAPDHTVEVPPYDRADEVGWYTESPTPGATGPSVLIGHVDSPDGPAVFYRLSQVSTGDRIQVRRSDGSRAVFAVTHVQTFLKSQFPTADVYGDTDQPVLRLITCGGDYVRSAGGYQGNTIAFAKLVDLRGEQQ